MWVASFHTRGLGSSNAYGLPGGNAQNGIRVVLRQLAEKRSIRGFGERIEGWEWYVGIPESAAG